MINPITGETTERIPPPAYDAVISSKQNNNKIQRDRRCILVDIFGVILKLIFIFSRKLWNSFSISLGPISIYICTKLLIINANFQPSRNLCVTLELYARN